MPASEKAGESTPLVIPCIPHLDPDHPHAVLFDRIDSEHCPDDVHDHPECPKKFAVKQKLRSAVSPSGFGHPVLAQPELQSPALLLRCKQSIEHGFSDVSSASHSLYQTVSKSEHPYAQSIYPVVLTVFGIAILTMVTMTAISPSLLLYMNYVGYTSPVVITPFVISSALQNAVPVFSTVMLGRLASMMGPGTALAVGSLVSAVGILIFAVARDNLWMFFFGYGLYAASNSLRVIRVAILSKVVPLKQRTTVLATHALMTPLGALVGPMLWIFFSTYRGTLSWGVFQIDRFSMAYGTAAFSLLLITLVSVTLLRRIPTPGGDGQGRDEDEELHDATIHMSDGSDQVVSLEQYRKRIFIYFCAIMLGVNMSAGVFMTAFQPVLVNVFHTSDAKLGLIFELIAVLAIIPPLLVALLSRYLMDRDILVIGLFSKLIGMSLFLPIFGPVQEWQVIVGFMLIIKASIFFSTASMSLFTKLLGAMSTSSLLGLLSSASSVGPAVAQIVLSRTIIELFGSYSFGWFGIPAVVSLGLVVWPRYWKQLDPESEFAQLVTREAELQHEHNGHGYAESGRDANANGLQE